MLIYEAISLRLINRLLIARPLKSPPKGWRRDYRRLAADRAGRRSSRQGRESSQPIRLGGKLNGQFRAPANRENADPADKQAFSKRSI